MINSYTQFKTFTNCSRCGELYELCDDNALRFGTYKVHEGQLHEYYIGNKQTHNLCPKCSKELENWLNKKTEIEHDEF